MGLGISTMMEFYRNSKQIKIIVIMEHVVPLVDEMAHPESLVNPSASLYLKLHYIFKLYISTKILICKLAIIFLSFSSNQI